MSSCATIGFDRWINWAKRPTGAALYDHRDLCVRDRAWCGCAYCAEERNPNWMPCDGDEGDDDE